MVQNIVQLPESAVLIVNDWDIDISNHKMVNGQLSLWILRLIKEGSWKKALKKMKEVGISFEAFIEECVTELEDILDIFEWMIDEYYIIVDEDFQRILMSRKFELDEFVKSPAGVDILEEIITKIRNCSDWEKFYDAMNLESEFSEMIQTQITTGIKQCKV